MAFARLGEVEAYEAGRRNNGRRRIQYFASFKCLQCGTTKTRDCTRGGAVRTGHGCTVCLRAKNIGQRVGSFTRISGQVWRCDCGYVKKNASPRRLKCVTCNKEDIRKERKRIAQAMLAKRHDVFGVMLTIHEMGELAGVHFDTVRKRIAAGKPCGEWLSARKGRGGRKMGEPAT